LTIDATEAVRLTNNARLLAQASSSGSAGTLTISTRNLFVNASEISTTAAQSGGGQIAINADQILLRNSSAITSSVIDGAGGGGNISFASKLFIALEDSDILANARFGDGGRIIIDSTVFLADLFANVGRNPGGNFAQFRGNGRVDISASSEFGVSGIVSVPDFSFLQNSLSSLAADFVNPDQVVAGSCIARRNTQQGSFTVTGTGGLARTPYDTGLFYPYEVVSVQGTEPSETKTQPQTSPALSTTWQPGDRIQEAQAMVTTADGRILLAVETDAGAIAPAYNLPCSN
jgi:large exoprotein involved in heme utilization and adhesion